MHADDSSTTNGLADTDISGPEFDFVRSIRAFRLEHASQETGRDGDCIQFQRVCLGTHGEQGDFLWRSSSVSRPSPTCSSDTSLVGIVGLTDLLLAVSQSPVDPLRRDRILEGYIFVPAIHRVFCLFVSWHGRRLEARSRLR